MITLEEIAAVFKLRDELSPAVAVMQENLRTAGVRMEEVGGSVKKLGADLLPISAAVAALGGYAIKTAIDFESAFSNVRKTVDASDDRLKVIEKSLRDMATEMPFAFEELSRIAAIGGQFGVSEKDILKFTETVAKLGTAIDGIEPDEAAAQLQQFAAVAGVSGERFGDLASMLVKLGNEGTSSEAAILELSKRLAVAGTQSGLTADQIFGLAASLANAGINAEAGGTAFSKVLLQMNDAVINGGKELGIFAQVAGMSADQFATAFRENATGAITAFLGGLGAMQKENVSTTATMDALHLADIRVTSSVGALALQHEKVVETMRTAKEEFASGGKALEKEYGEKAITTANQLKVLWNNVREVAAVVGEAFLPVIKGAADFLKDMMPYLQGAAEKFKELPTPVAGIVLALGGLVAAAAPLLLAFGALSASAGAVATAFGTGGVFAGAFNTAAGIVTGLGSVLATVAAALVSWPAIIAAVVAGLVTWVVGWDNVKAAALAVWDGIKLVADVIGSLFSLGIVYWTKELTEGWESVKTAASAVADAFAWMMREALGLTSGNIEAGVKKIGDAWDWCMEKVRGFKDILDALLAMPPPPPPSPDIYAKPFDTAKEAADGLAIAFGKVDENLGIIAGTTMGELEKSHAAATEAAKKQAAELAKLTGADIIAAAQTLVQQVAAVGGASNLTEAAQKRVNEAMNAALAVYAQFGQTAPPAMEALALATGALADSTNDLKTLANDLPAVMGTWQAPARAEMLLTSRDMAGAFTTSVGSISKAMGSLVDVSHLTGQEVTRTLAEPAKDVEVTWGDSLNAVGASMAQAAQRAIEGGGSISQAMIGAFGQSAQKMLTDHKDKLGLSEGALEMVGSAVAGAAAGMANFNAVNEGASKSSTILSGALTGVAEGFKTGNIAAGLLAGGMAILGGLFGDAERKVNDTRDAFVSANGGLHNLNVMAVQAGTSLNALLDANNPKKYEAAVADLKAKFAEFQERLQQFGEDLAFVMESGTLLTRDLIKEMTELRDKANLDPLLADQSAIEDMFGFLQDNLKKVTEGFNTAVDAWSEPLLELAKNADKSQEALDKLKSSGKASGEEIAKATAQAARDQEALQKAVADNEDDFRRFGSLAVGVYGALQDGGYDAIDALEAMRPALEDLSSVQAALGLETSESFGQMLEFARLADEFEPLLRQTSGLTDVMVGLANTGLLTQEMFADLGTQVAGAYEEMVKGGASADGAMRMIQPSLQRMWELQTDFGYAVDDSTQKLIDQAVEAGLVGDNFRDAQDRMIEAVNALVDRLGALVDMMSGTVPGAFEAGAGRASGAISGIGGAAWQAANEANAAIGSINWGGLEGAGTDALGEIEDAGARAAWGSSPTGIKEIGVAAKQVTGDMQAMSASGQASLRELERQAAESAKAMQKALNESAAVGTFGVAGESAQDRAAQSLRAKAMQDWVRGQASLMQALVDEIAVPMKETLINAITLKPEEMGFENVFDYLARVQVDRFLKGLAADEVSTINAVLEAQKNATVVTKDLYRQQQQAHDEMVRGWVENTGYMLDGLESNVDAMYTAVSDFASDAAPQFHLITKAQAQLPAGTREWIGKLMEAGEAVDGMSDKFNAAMQKMFLAGAGAVVDGFEKSAGGLQAMLDAIKEQEDARAEVSDDFSDQIADAQDAANDAAEAISDLREKQVELREELRASEAGSKDYVNIQREMASVARELSTAEQDYTAAIQSKATLMQSMQTQLEGMPVRDWTEFTTAAFDTLGATAGVAFAKAVQGGASFLDAITKLQPSLVTLSDTQEKFGLTASPILDQMMRWGDLAKENAPVLQFVAGLDDMMTGLGNTVSLTQEVFDEISQGIMAAAKELTTNTQAALTNDEAMRFMQPTLQKLWEMWQTMGFEVDGSTQALLTQAQSAGIVGSAFMSAEERIAMSVEKMVASLDRLVERMTLVADTAALLGGMGLGAGSLPQIPVWGEDTIQVRDNSGQLISTLSEAYARLDLTPGGTTEMFINGQSVGMVPVAGLAELLRTFQSSNPNLTLSQQPLPEASGGGHFSGPDSGYPVMLHGDETVTKTPLRGDVGYGEQVIIIELDGHVISETAVRGMPRILRARQRGRV